MHSEILQPQRSWMPRSDQPDARLRIGVPDWTQSYLEGVDHHRAVDARKDDFQYPPWVGSSDRRTAIREDLAADNAIPRQWMHHQDLFMAGGRDDVDARLSSAARAMASVATTYRLRGFCVTIALLALRHLSYQFEAAVEGRHPTRRFSAALPSSPFTNIDTHQADYHAGRGAGGDLGARQKVQRKTGSRSDQ